MYICQTTAALIFSPRQKKREAWRQREREVTLLAEWQWPSCIASLKRGGGGEGGGEGRVNVTFKCLLATLP